MAEANSATCRELVEIGPASRNIYKLHLMSYNNGSVYTASRTLSHYIFTVSQQMTDDIVLGNKSIDLYLTSVITSPCKYILPFCIAICNV